MEEKTWQSNAVLWIQVILGIGIAGWLFMVGFFYAIFLIPSLFAQVREMTELKVCTVAFTVATVPMLLLLWRTIRCYRPLTLILGSDSVRLRRNNSEEVLAYRDIEAVECLDGGMVRLRPRQTFFDRQGKRRPIFANYRWTIPGGVFDGAQLDEFVPLLEQRAIQAHDLECPPPPPANVQLPAHGTAVRTWTGKPERAIQAIMVIFAAAVIAMGVYQVRAIPYAYTDGPFDVWVGRGFQVAIVGGLIFLIYFYARLNRTYCQALTLTVDDAGISLRESKRIRTIAFTEIAALTTLTTLPAFAGAIIWPKADFLAKRGVKPSQKLSRRWIIRDFSDAQLREMLPLLQQGVERAGGMLQTTRFRPDGNYDDPTAPPETPATDSTPADPPPVQADPKSAN